MYQLIIFTSLSVLALKVEFVAYVTPSWLHQVEQPLKTIDVGLIYGLVTSETPTGGSNTHGIICFFLLVHLLVFTITFAPLLHRLILTSRASLSSPRVLSISFNQLSNINAVSFGYSWYLGWLTFGLILTSVMANGIFYKKIFEDTPVPKPKAVVGTVLLKRN